MKRDKNFGIVMRDGGSSILEVMIAIILFAIATAGLAITIPFAMDRANVWRDQGGLNVYLEDQLENVRRLTFTALTIADTGVVTDGDYTYRRVTTLVKPGIDGNGHATWVTAASAGTGDGLLGTYYDNINFTGPTIGRTDAAVNFNWGTGAPFPAMGVDTFSVRWTGYVEAISAGVYTFYTTSDDGVRLWVNNQLIIDSWIEQSATEHSGTITLAAGQRYSIRLEYYENGGDAVCTLSWSKATAPAIAKAIIPQAQIYSTLPKLTTVTVTKPSASLTLVGRVLTLESTKLRFDAYEDTYVAQNSAGTNYGTLDTFYLRYRTNQMRWGYMKFTVAGINNRTITSVKLRLNESLVAAQYPLNFSVYKTTGAWTETGVTWTNRPTYNATSYGTYSGTPLNGGLVEVTLDNAFLVGDGTYQIVLITATTGNTNPSGFFTREMPIGTPAAPGLVGPQLIIELQP